ncbi:MAG: D-alanine--D-alanine ligase, partial [Planctomycetota bacterium]|nr:D-alanine--D-alanine ligase [Planctomycetota bacterium]
MKILVLGGGPDAEREVSINSATCVSKALESRGHDVDLRIIDSLTATALRKLKGDVILPILHGRWGEGGPLQDLLVKDGRPFLGAGPAAARLAMDKLATKSIAAQIGVPTTVHCVLDPNDDVCPLPLPVVVKPVHEGSTIGLHICRT